MNNTFSSEDEGFTWNAMLSIGAVIVIITLVAGASLHLMGDTEEQPTYLQSVSNFFGFRADVVIGVVAVIAIIVAAVFLARHFGIISF